MLHLNVSMYNSNGEHGGRVWPWDLTSGRWDDRLCVAQVYRCNAPGQVGQNPSIETFTIIALCLSNLEPLTSVSVNSKDRLQLNEEQSRPSMPASHDASVVLTVHLHSLYSPPVHRHPALKLHASTPYPQQDLPVTTYQTHTTISG